MPHLFEQQARESSKAFAAFSLYLSLGPQRSTAAVAKKLAKSHQLVRRWSAKHDWLVRVKAHGAHMAAAEHEAAKALVTAKGVDWAKRQEEHREKEWEARCKLVHLAETAIKRWLEKPERCGSLEGIARLLDLASRLGRLASGLPTDKTEITGELNATLNVEVAMALEKVYGETIDVEEVQVTKPKVQSLVEKS